MSRTHVIRGALLAGATGALVACNSDTHVTALKTNNSIFQSYVAIGNSITAGFQSGGINDSTQKQSYAYLLAQKMGTRYAYPSLVMPGCPPPISNLLTQARVGGATSTAGTCNLRSPASIGASLNNVAVPGITSFEPTQSIGNATSAALEELILGGKTQVLKALDAKPTFVTVWIGNNDILSPALSGFPNGQGGTAPGAGGPATTVVNFQANYSKMINQLVAGAPGVKGVLIAVVQVTNVPLVFQAGVLANPAVAPAAQAVAGRPVVLDPITCAGANAGALVNFQYIAAIAARPAGFPGTVYCQKVLGGGPSDPGDNGILDLTEQATVTTLINGYNSYIKAKADSIGFAYYDPNTTLGTLKANGSIPAFPNVGSATAPFGQYFSFDGVHPTAAAHILLANDLITVINAKFGTTLSAAP
ncbi:MAG: SGNH/GDSL hydrolase family protein [Gemmatimonadaceae bacterium]